MKKLNFHNRTLKILLCTSILINLSSLVLILFYEIRTHDVQIVLNTLGLCDIDESDKPDFYCINAWDRCIKKLNIDYDIAFMGNSIIYGGNFQREFNDKKIIEFGYPGDRVDKMIRRVPMLQSVNPEKIFIMGGINDLHRSYPQTIYKRYDNLITSIKERLPNAKIYIQSILPISRNQEKNYAKNSVINKTNRLIMECAIKHKCTYIDLNSSFIKNGVLPSDFTDDGVHLTQLAYEKWYEIIRPYIYE